MRKSLAEIKKDLNSTYNIAIAAKKQVEMEKSRYRWYLYYCVVVWLSSVFLAALSVFVLLIWLDTGLSDNGLVILWASLLVLISIGLAVLQIDGTKIYRHRIKEAKKEFNRKRREYKLWYLEHEKLRNVRDDKLRSAL